MQKKSIPDYLALHSEVDFILDTYPYAGGTTTGFALWMGVPVLTYVWQSLPGRAGFSWLSNVGLEDKFAAYTQSDFIELAKMWGQNINELQELRYKIREYMQHGEKLKPQNATNGVEKALRMMWQKFCLENKVKAFSVLEK